METKCQYCVGKQYQTTFHWNVSHIYICPINNSVHGYLNGYEIYMNVVLEAQIAVVQG